MKIDISKTFDFIKENEIFSFEQEIKTHLIALENKTGKGNDFLGWLDLPSRTSDTLIADIEETAKRIRQLADVVVVIGIGGSYLGARAIIDALDNPFSTYDNSRTNPHIVYAGHHLGEDYFVNLINFLDNKSYAIIVISKSGTTTEPAIAFRLLKNHIEKKYGKEKAKERIVAITDKAKGALKKLADNEGYKTFEIPDDVGGRFSVLTPVGLLPIAIAGFNIRELLNGAQNIEKESGSNIKFADNKPAIYAACRNALYKSGKKIEILANYLPSLHYITEWWKQLYGESEGKQGLGIFPAGVDFTTDLHSMGQYIQDGQRILFETVLNIEQSSKQLVIPTDPDNADGLNFLAGKRLTEVNKMATLGTMLAHIEGGVPNIILTLPVINEFYLGELIYFFEKACAVSGYILGVNPFDQPGVEAYKSNMFALLDKPGFEQQSLLLKKKVSFIKYL